MGKKGKKNRIHICRNPEGIKFSVTGSELNRAIDHLKRVRKKVRGAVKNDFCKSMRCAKQFESEIALHCRQLPSVAHALRKAILRQDWKEAVVFTSLLCQPGITRYAAVIVKACLILLFNHPKSNIDLLEKFIRSCTGYISTVEITKFVKILFSTREENLSVLGAGKYIRSCSHYKVVDDVTFKDL